jgi:putative membrane protein
MPKQLKEFLQRCVITAVAVLIATQMIPGIQYDNWHGLAVATIVLVLLNAFIRPVLMFLSLPLVVLTLGIFIIVINAVLLYFVGRMKYFHVDTFGAAFWGALVISIVSLVLNSLTGSGNARVTVQRGKGPPPPSKSDTGNGPVIDV